MVSLSTVAVFFLTLPPSLACFSVFSDFRNQKSWAALHCLLILFYSFLLFTSPDINLPLAKLEHGSNYVFLSVFYVAVRHCFSIMDSLIGRRRTVTNGEGGKRQGGQKSCWLRRKWHHLPLKHRLRHDSGSALGPINRYFNTNLQRNILWEKLINQDWLCGLIIRPKLKLAVNLTELPRGTQTILMSVHEWNSLNSFLQQTHELRKPMSRELSAWWAGTSASPWTSGNPLCSSRTLPLWNNAFSYFYLFSFNLCLFID